VKVDTQMSTKYILKTMKINNNEMSFF
jgi:hypothetical protein